MHTIKEISIEAAVALVTANGDTTLQRALGSTPEKTRETLTKYLRAVATNDYEKVRPSKLPFDAVPGCVDFTGADDSSNVETTAFREGSMSPSVMLEMRQAISVYDINHQSEVSSALDAATRVKIAALLMAELNPEQTDGAQSKNSSHDGPPPRHFLEGRTPPRR